MKIVEKGNTLVITNITRRSEVRHIVKNLLPTKTKVISLKIIAITGTAFDSDDNQSALYLFSAVAKMPSLISLYLRVWTISSSLYEAYDKALSKSNLLQYSIQLRYTDISKELVLPLTDAKISSNHVDFFAKAERFLTPNNTEKLPTELTMELLVSLNSAAKIEERFENSLSITPELQRFIIESDQMLAKGPFNWIKEAPLSKLCPVDINLLISSYLSYSEPILEIPSAGEEAPKSESPE